MKSTSVLSNFKLPKLKSAEEFVPWREDSLKILDIYGLSHCIDPTKRRFTIPVYPPCSADLRELEFRQRQSTIDERKKAKSDNEYVTVYFALHDAIPKQNVRNWTKGITESTALWAKIETMCHYREDHNLKKFYRKIYEELKCNSSRLGDIINYQTALEGALGDYEHKGGFITMDDINDKVKKDLKPFKSIYEDLITFTIKSGSELINYPSTNGWTYTLMLERVKKFMHAFDGPNYIKKRCYSEDDNSNNNQESEEDSNYESEDDNSNDNQESEEDSNYETGDDNSNDNQESEEDSDIQIEKEIENHNENETQFIHQNNNTQNNKNKKSKK
jgi:hypothetical protein